MIMTNPTIIERPAQPYVAIRAEVSPSELAGAVDRQFKSLFAWMGQRHIEPIGAPFIKYDRIDMAATVAVEFGAPTATRVESAGDVIAEVLPAGRYGTLVYEGPYDGLRAANAALIEWAKKSGIHWDSTLTPAGEHFVCRLETYVTDPRKEPDAAKWLTELAIRLQ
jgi:effector-binding domain-containing protein